MNRKKNLTSNLHHNTIDFSVSVGSLNLVYYPLLLGSILSACAAVCVLQELHGKTKRILLSSPKALIKQNLPRVITYRSTSKYVLRL